MTFVCLSIPSSSTGAAPSAEGADGDPGAERLLAKLAPAALAIAPRIVVEPRGVLWADARGLAAHAIAGALLECARRCGVAAVRAGVAATAVAAEVAATHGAASGQPPDAITIVAPGTDRAFLAPHALAVLSPSLRLVPLLRAAGLECCGDLAAIDLADIEVRFGAEGAALWRLARADDPRLLFAPLPRSRPTASLEWTEYTLRDPERLLFILNALTTSVCTELRSWGEGTRTMGLAFTLAGGGSFEHAVRAARTTASRKSWMHRIRAELERLVLPEAVTGITLRAESVAGTLATQGDLFDRGFATASAVESAMAELLEEREAVVVERAGTSHPLPERRTLWRERGLAVWPSAPRADGAASISPASATRGAASPRLALQLLPEPRRIVVATVTRRGHRVPVRYRDREDAHALPRDVSVVMAAGPDCLSGGEADAPYAREYFHCVTEAGTLVLLFRNARTGIWYLHGWWD